MEQALEEARRELGDDIVIMHSQRRRGILGSTYVVTVGVEDDIPLPDYKDAFEAAEAGRARLADQMPAQAVPASLNEVRSNSVFNAVADEPVSIPPLAPQEAADRSEDRDGADSLTSKVSAEELRSTFQAVEEVIAKSREPVEESPLSKTTYNRRASLVRYNDPAGSVEYTRDTPARKPRRQFVSPREESVSVGKDSFETEGTLERGEEIAEHKNKIIRAIYKVLMDHEVDER